MDGPPRKRRFSDVSALLSDRIAADKTILNELSAIERARHEELINALGGLRSLMEAQIQQDNLRRQEELERRAQDKEQQAALTAALLTLSVNISKST